MVSLRAWFLHSRFSYRAWEQRLRSRATSRLGQPQFPLTASPVATRSHRLLAVELELQPQCDPPISSMASRRKLRRRSMLRRPAFDFPQRRYSSCRSTSLLRPMPQAASRAAGPATRQSWIPLAGARAQKKRNPCLRKYFPAASLCWADSGWAELERSDLDSIDLRQADASRPPTARRAAAAGMRAWSRSR